MSELGNNFEKGKPRPAFIREVIEGGKSKGEKSGLSEEQQLAQIFGQTPASDTMKFAMQDDELTIGGKEQIPKKAVEQGRTKRNFKAEAAAWGERPGIPQSPGLSQTHEREESEGNE